VRERTGLSLSCALLPGQSGVDVVLIGHT
jgi:hypothetical protein